MTYGTPVAGILCGTSCCRHPRPISLTPVIRSACLRSLDGAAFAARLSFAAWLLAAFVAQAKLLSLHVALAHVLSRVHLRSLPATRASIAAPARSKPVPGSGTTSVGGF